MGAEPWSCFVAYRPDASAALEAAQAQEFAAGRYRVMDPGDPPASIEEARLQGEESGTASVLDMTGVAEEPLAEGAGDWMASGGDLPASFGMVAPLTAEQLVRLYGTDRPTRSQVASNFELYDLLDRGLGVYVVVYDGDTPTEIFFAGYSFD